MIMSRHDRVMRHDYVITMSHLSHVMLWPWLHSTLRVMTTSCLGRVRYIVTVSYTVRHDLIMTTLRGDFAMSHVMLSRDTLRVMTDANASSRAARRSLMHVVWVESMRQSPIS